jgi:hypothetical protein
MNNYEKLFYDKNKKDLHKHAILFFVFILSLLYVGCKGSALDLHSGDYLGDPTIEDGDGTRGDGTPQIYPVTTIVEATSEIPSWSAADLPFTGPRRALGVVATDSQWPFEFNYTYPPNNYNLGEARLSILTSRDNSDTEAIFVDGVFTGRPPSAMVSSTSTKITHRNYSCVGVCSGGATPTGPANTFFMDWALSHYKVATQNTFDLNLADLLTPTTRTIADIISDGSLKVVTGDDAFVGAAGPSNSNPILVLQGYTVSNVALTCTTSPEYKYKNTYIHNDGNSIGQSAFSGTVDSPVSSWGNAYTGFRSVEFYYDPRLPQLTNYTGLNISKAEITLQIKRFNTDPVAIVINGIGIDQTGFDRSTATVGVESWSVTATTIDAWNTLVSSIPATNVSTPITINLLNFFSVGKLKELLLQGKLNISIAGPVATVYGQNATSTRTYGVSVNGPELILEGSFTAQVCQVPNNPTSPLNNVGGNADCLTDVTGPALTSISASQITATTATIKWLTNENASSQIGYGVGNTNTLSPLNSTQESFHSVTLTGLSPYKYYQYVVKSADSCGNSTTSSVTNVFRTLR